MGYGSSYERYIVLRVERGKIRERLALGEAEFERYRDYQFRLFQKTDEYRRTLEDLGKRMESLSKPQLIDFMREFHSERYLAIQSGFGSTGAKTRRDRRHVDILAHDLIDPRQRRALPQPCLQGIQRLRIASRHHFDPAIRKIDGMAGKPALRSERWRVTKRPAPCH